MTDYQQAASGGITPAGSKTEQISRKLAAWLWAESDNTIVATMTIKADDTSFIPAGAAYKGLFEALSGALGPSGGLARGAGKALNGLVAGAGTLCKQIPIHITGTLVTVGALFKQIPINITGTLTTAGTLARRIARSIAGALSAIVGSLATLKTSPPSPGRAIVSDSAVHTATVGDSNYPTPAT